MSQHVPAASTLCAQMSTSTVITLQPPQAIRNPLAHQLTPHQLVTVQLFLDHTINSFVAVEKRITVSWLVKIGRQ
jgi:hypothetical protein